MASKDSRTGPSTDRLTVRAAELSTCNMTKLYMYMYVVYIIKYRPPMLSLLPVSLMLSSKYQTYSMMNNAEQEKYKDHGTSFSRRQTVPGHHPHYQKSKCLLHTYEVKLAVNHTHTHTHTHSSTHTLSLTHSSFK